MKKLMSTKSAVIKIDEIRSIYEEYWREEGKDFNENEFKEFLKFLEIDFFDWVRENLRQFSG